MSNVMVTRKDGSSVVLRNTTVAAVVTALGTGEGQSSFTLVNGEVVALSNTEINGLAEQAAGTQAGGDAIGGEEPGSGHNPNAPGT